MTPIVETEDVNREEQIILINNEKEPLAENTNNKPLAIQVIARQARSNQRINENNVPTKDL
jgi:hypothetical protein